MRILVLGGTRFVGKALATCLVEAGQDVVVSSRRPQNAPAGSTPLGGERNEVIKRLAGEYFDWVIDFTCYGEEDAKAVLATFPESRILFISSIWVTRLATSMMADAPFQEDSQNSNNLPTATLDYLRNKIAAEKVFYAARQREHLVTIIRLPIIWGEGDHTGRLDFYRSRLLDNHPLILVNEGKNLAQISWSLDVAKGLTTLILGTNKELPLIVEAGADPGRPIIEIVADISEALDVELKIASISDTDIAEHLPEYLDFEPLWRENGRSLTTHNLFKITNKTPTLMSDWLRQLSLPVFPHGPDRALRGSESTLIQSMGYTIK